MESTLNLYMLTPDDWKLLKAARLQALHDSPTSFARTTPMSCGGASWNGGKRSSTPHGSLLVRPKV
jgi:hypothetical protein